ncbi:MAG: toll/interleukin-1 receptor domain-containing protein [Candidatus Acidiferrales bacterium]
MTETAQAAQHRDTLLLSHANPEDNEFTLWLALQLANEGYRVWCDLTKLLGGEVFWDNIEEVIKARAVKVLYVLSKTSNGKDGPLKELHFAQGVAKKEKLKDFVIPLQIDDLPHGDITIEITRINTVALAKSWGAGLAKLLEKLEEDGVSKDPKFNRTAVNDWWRTQFSAEQGLSKEPEEYLSNWFPVSLPRDIYFHSLSRKSTGVPEVAPALPYPAVQDGRFLITFAGAADFEDRLGPGMYIAQAGEPLVVTDLLAEPKSTFGKHLFQLLRVAWEQMLAERKLPVYELANKLKCFYFPKNRVPNDKVFFTGVDGEKTYRAMVGFSTRTSPATGVSVKRYWHYAVQARPMVHPMLAYIFKSHVLFTNDGTTIWESKKKLAAARRSQCKSWWNDEWRDRTLAAATYLCDGADNITVKLGSNISLLIPPSPMPYRSPVSYTDTQLLRYEEDAEAADDYGRDARDDDAFEDDPSEGGAE